MVGVLEHPDAGACCACKSPLFVAEQFAFQNRLHQPCAVEGHETVVAPLAVVVDGQGHQLLARAGLPPDQNGGIRCGGLLDALQDPEHRRAVAYDVLHAVAAENLAAQRLPVTIQRDVVRCAVHHQRKLGPVERLLQVGAGPGSHGIHCVGGAALVGDDDHLCLRVTCTCSPYHLPSAPPAHREVRDDDLEGARARLLGGMLQAGLLRAGMPHGAQRRGDGLRHLRFALGDQDIEVILHGCGPLTGRSSRQPCGSTGCDPRPRSAP